ncbi:MAG: exodeoxyribonuclease VII large subunit [Bacteroidota bacterium]
MEHLTLLELNKTVKATLDANLQPTYWVVAEIGELRTHQSGHCYLELVEKSEDKVVAKSRATIWSYTYRNLSVWFEGITGEPLKKGLKILCNVNIQYHELYGLSLNVKDIDANYTLGERARRRQEIIDQLVQDGIFELNKELRLPMVAQRIAVISSPSAAGYGDFTEQLDQNHKGYDVHITLFKAAMQGDSAAESIINALLSIHNQSDQYDLVVIIRGGGSQIDLDCFDHYELAAHIAQFPIPILTGIGHERDETIADLVAHTKLKTPTAVAEFLLSGYSAFEDKLDLCFSKLYQLTNTFIQAQDQQLLLVEQSVRSLASNLINSEENTLKLYQKDLKSLSKQVFRNSEHDLEMREKALHLLNPESAFKRGYTITSLKGKALKHKNPKIGDIIETYSLNVKLTSSITDIEKRND